MDFRQRFRDKAEAYILGAVLLPLSVGGFYSLMDARHEPRGAVDRSELLRTRQEIRQLETYEDLVPSDKYSPARQVLLKELRDDETELVERLEATKQ